MKIEQLNFSFDNKQVFHDFNLEIEHGSITALMAPSGSGKTTLLRLIAGLIKPQSGVIDTNGQTVGIMFQEPRLFGYNGAPFFENESWVMITAKIELKKHHLYQNKGPVLKVLSAARTDAPEVEVVTFA